MRSCPRASSRAAPRESAAVTDVLDVSWKPVGDQRCRPCPLGARRRRRPAVTGELEIPGFSAHLHPVDDDTVVGFGPDPSLRRHRSRGAGRSRRAPPSRDDSPVVWDHHAYVGLDDGRLAVPVTDWPTATGWPCITDLPVPGDTSSGTDLGSGGRRAASTGGATPPCSPTTSGGSTGVAVLGIDGNSFGPAERQVVDSDGSTSAERGVLTPDGAWLLLSWDRLVPTDGGASIPLPIDPAMSGRKHVTD